jgi:tetratricopeptide (TPR) repeat protein
MHIDTASRQAFEQVTSAMELIERFQRSRDYSVLETADADLSAAVKADPNYLSAVYYSGIVKDLIGRAADAPPFFERIAKEITDPDIRAEALYNLGVAYYHQYSKDKLQKAQGFFGEVIASSRDEGLRLLAQANLAQTYAMKMHPDSGQSERLQNENTVEQVKREIRKEFDQALENATEVLEAVKKRGRKIKKEGLWKKIQATAHNALGMASMYYTDRLASNAGEVKKYLHLALQHLTSAKEELSSDWANTCDLASVHFRFFVAEFTADRDREFSKAKNLLELVLRELRPGYGFAYYELGRLLRCAAQFEDAIVAFNSSLAVDRRYRDVSDDRIKSEKKRAEHGDKSFP